jgi:hypothetical protein
MNSKRPRSLGGANRARGLPWDNEAIHDEAISQLKDRDLFCSLSLDYQSLATLVCVESSSEQDLGSPSIKDHLAPLRNPAFQD